MLYYLTVILCFQLTGELMTQASGILVPGPVIGMALLFCFLLGPATVALAIALYRQFEKVRRSAVAILASILCGSLTAIVTATGTGYVLDASRDALIALAPKSATPPVAMGIW